MNKTKISFKFEIKQPRVPTLKRYRKLFINNNSSLTRKLQYEKLAITPLPGRVLDFGGGNKAKYINLINVEHYDSVNIDSAIDPTFMTKVGEKIPCKNQTYDTILSLNTIEHIYDSNFIIEEFARILKEGGTLVCALPFLFPIHAHPDDFFRPTASWWIKTLEIAGFTSIKITPLLWGPFTTGIVCSGLPGPFRKIRTHIALLKDLVYSKLHFGFKQKHYTGKIGKTISNHCLSYFIEAKK